jgi:hypothetical protein
LPFLTLRTLLLQSRASASLLYTLDNSLVLCNLAGADIVTFSDKVIMNEQDFDTHDMWAAIGIS